MSLHRLDVSIRLRRAIFLNDLLLVKRIVRNHPAYIHNPDFTDRGNTSLHVAAKLGFVEIAVSFFFLPLYKNFIELAKPAGKGNGAGADQVESIYSNFSSKLVMKRKRSAETRTGTPRSC